MAFRTLTAILVLPAVISLALLLVNAAWYQSSMLRMEEVAALKPVVSTDIPEMVWVAVSGRATFENCGVYEAIDEVNRSLDAMTAKDGPGARLELTVARRTMETLTQYVRQIEENLKSNVPVVESERVLEEVRDVASLVDSMLEDYISAEISLSAQSNRRMTRVVILSAVSGGADPSGRAAALRAHGPPRGRPHPQPHRAAGALRRHDGRRQPLRPACRPRTSASSSTSPRASTSWPTGWNPSSPRTGRSRKTCANPSCALCRRRSTRTFSTTRSTPSYGRPRPATAARSSTSPAP